MHLGDTVYEATDTRTPHLLTFDGLDGGKSAQIIGRWANAKGQPGPISETVSATIPG